MPGKKMKKIFPYEAGKTLDSHKEFLRKLTKRGAKKVELDESDVTIVFCPIVSRYETDINSALSSATDQGCTKMILVAMHPTFDKDYTLPSHRDLGNNEVILHVDCLFFEKRGLYKCPCNTQAVRAVRKKLGLPKRLKRKSKCSIA